MHKCKCKRAEMVDCCFSLRAVIMLLEQRASQMGGDFSLRWRVRRETLGSLVLRACLWFMGINHAFIDWFYNGVQTPYQIVFFIIGPRAERYFACGSHAHLVSKDGSVISGKSPITCIQMERQFTDKLCNLMFTIACDSSAILSINCVACQ